MDAAAWDERYASADLLWMAEPNRFLVAEVAGVAPGRALDLGAGEGRNSMWLASQGWLVTAVDFSAVAVERAGRLAADRGEQVASAVTWVCADVRSWEGDGCIYDLVVNSFLHLPGAERRALHARAAGMLAPGGLLLVVGYDLANRARGAGGPDDPDRLLTTVGLTEELSGAGLEVELAETLEIEGPNGTALDVLVRARKGRDRA